MQSLKLSQSDLANSHAAQLRILQLLPDLSGTPVNRRALSLSQAINTAGGHVAVASSGGRMEALFRRAGAEHIIHESRGGRFSSKSTLSLLEEIHRAGTTLLHVHMLDDGLAAKALADAANIPLVMTCHELPDSSRFFARRSVRKHLTGRPLMAVSQFLADRLVGDFGVPQDIVHAVPAGLDIQDFSPEVVTTERTIALADKWGVVEDPRAIVLVPNASADPTWLRQILPVVADPDTPDMIWVLVAEDGGDVDELMVKSGVGDRVRWVETIDDWPAAYKLSALVVDLPLKPQAHCWAALEAQAMGRPVILTDTGAAAEAMLPNQTGWLIPDADPKALTAALNKVAAQDELTTASLSMAARNFVATRQSVTAMQQATLEHYRSALG